MKKIKIKVDDFELRLIIRALVEWRNALLSEDKPTEDLDEMLDRCEADRLDRIDVEMLKKRGATDAQIREFLPSD